MVRIIFDKYVHEGFGAQRIATYLNKQGYRARTGKMWHHASIRGIVCNLTYTGVLRCGESRSQTLPHLQIIAAGGSLKRPSTSVQTGPTAPSRSAMSR